MLNKSGDLRIVPHSKIEVLMSNIDKVEMVYLITKALYLKKGKISKKKNYNNNLNK